MSSVVLSSMVRVITSPERSKISPSKYSVFVGAVFTMILVNLAGFGSSSSHDKIPIIMIESKKANFLII